MFINNNLLHTSYQRTADPVKTWIPAIKDFKMQYDYRRFFMGTRIAIYNYATKATGGYIDVDSFEYSKRK